MNLTVPLAGYFLAVLIIMFWGTQATVIYARQSNRAGIVITLLCSGAIVWFVGTIISQIINAKN